MPGMDLLLLVTGAPLLLHARALGPQAHQGTLQTSEALDAACTKVDGVDQGSACVEQAESLGLSTSSPTDGGLDVGKSSTKAADVERAASLSSVWVEVACFCVAFAVIRLVSKRKVGSARPRSQKKICEADAKGPTTLESWRAFKVKGPASPNELQYWAGRVLAAEPGCFVEEFVGHLAENKGSDLQKGAAGLLVDVAAKAGRPDLIDCVAKAVKEQLGAEVEARHLRQGLLSASATAGLSEKVEVLLAQERTEAASGKASLHSYALVVRGYLKCGRIQGAAEKLLEMQKAGHEIPSHAVTELVQGACRVGLAEAALNSCGGMIKFPPDAVSAGLEHCAQADDLALAQRFHQLAQDQGTPLLEESYEALLKLYVKVDDSRAVEVFNSMTRANFHPCEGLCRFLMARCADSRNLRLAEAMVDHLRATSEMTFATYKTLMKVYAYAGLYDKACDLYTEIKAQGMEPDSVMYGSLMKFAVKAGRTQLSQELFKKADGGCVQNYMWLIRLAGQEGDVDRAVEVFRKLQTTQPDLVDVMAYNITIDACASNKDMARAEELLQEMRRTQVLNLVTYNTLMKGHCVSGNVKEAKKVFKEMEDAGIAPDTASFSCLLSGAAKVGDFKEAWNIIGEMDRRGIHPDSYVVSIMMQASRKAQNPKDADRALTVLDRPDVRICEDEVVFNTVLDACIFRRDRKRLARAIAEYGSGKVRPGVRTFGLLIKGSAVLRRTQSCWDFWREMVETRGLLPNDITLGCMIDALVEAQQVDDALALFQEWKQRIKCDTIIYSTLIKGFSSSGDANRAMALYRDMRSSGVQMNHIVYTALINAHARQGLMKRAELLLEDMLKDGCQPNQITYSSLVKGHCVRGDLSAALGLFHQMLGQGFPADSVMFNTLLDGCVQQANFQLADELLAEMKHHNVAPSNYTLSIIVKMWSKRGELDKAFDAIRAALRDPHSRHVDAQVGACIVGACIHNRAPQRALDVFEEMKTWPRFDGPDANTYSALISGLPRHGYIRKAVQLAEEACVTLRTPTGQDRRPLAPNALQQLFRALRGEGLLAELGRPLASKLRAAGMTVEAHWLS